MFFISCSAETNRAPFDLPEVEVELVAGYQSPTLGAHTHAHAHPCPWVLGGHGCDVIVHGWAYSVVVSLQQ